MKVEIKFRHRDGVNRLPRTVVMDITPENATDQRTLKKLAHTRYTLSEKPRRNEWHLCVMWSEDGS
jgi:hypothetical protein